MIFLILTLIVENCLTYVFLLETQSVLKGLRVMLAFLLRLICTLYNEISYVRLSQGCFVCVSTRSVISFLHTSRLQQIATTFTEKMSQAFF